MADAVQLKEEGNKYFQEGYIDKAIEVYTQALKLCKDKKVLAVICRNRSACYLKKVRPIISIIIINTHTHTCTHTYFVNASKYPLHNFHHK